MIKMSHLLSVLFLFNACFQTNCEQLPKSYDSYDEALSLIRAAKFQYEDKANTSKSSWIRGAEYYSCDGKTGYFILITDSKEYIHAGMPLDVWEGFKNAESFGKYYNDYIKHKYLLSL
jgi:hypothetical protein